MFVLHLVIVWLLFIATAGRRVQSATQSSFGSCEATAGDCRKVHPTSSACLSVAGKLCCTIYWFGVEDCTNLKPNLAHFSFKIWHLMATILMIFLRVNYSKCHMHENEMHVGNWIMLYQNWRSITGSPSHHRLTCITAIKLLLLLLCFFLFFSLFLL